MKKINLLPLGAALCLMACGSGSGSDTSPVSAGAPAPAPVAQTSSRHFGFALVDCGYDDPLDADHTTNYLPEVASFSSTAQLCVFSPADSIGDRLALMAHRQVGAFLSIQALLYEPSPDASTGSGIRLRLRPDHAARWRQFVDSNALRQRLSSITAFYLADEPTWNGLSPAELRAGADLIKAEFPQTPIALVEAAPSLPALQVPPSVDWIGFDHYAVPQPDTNPTYLGEFQALKAKRTRATQKLLLVMDAQWLPFYGQAGYAESDMKAVATSYSRLAEKEQADVVGLLGYTWPGGLDHPRQKGARELPAAVKDEYARIGRLMTGKP